MQYKTLALPLALASSALANPLLVRDDACAAAVTGNACLGDENLRAADCKSYIATTVTPAAYTSTVTITAVGVTTTPSSGWEKWKRDESKSVYVCPNAIPKYASACADEASYKSACKAFGYSGDTTTTLAPATETQTVFAAPSGECGKGGSTVTVTVTSGGAAPTGAPGPGKCVSNDTANYIVNGFINLLESTNYNGTQAPPGHGFNVTLANEILAPTFQDYSDSINFLAGYPLGTATFPNRTAFIYGQGSQPEVKVDLLNLWHSCDAITFRYRLFTGAGANLPVVGVNQMELTSDLTQVQTQYAEFDNAAWLTDLGNPECKKSKF